MTADLDLVVRLDPDNARAALRALGSLGFRPRAPVPAEQFADSALALGAARTAKVESDRPR